MLVTVCSLSGSPARFTVCTLEGRSLFRTSSAIADGTVLISVDWLAAASVGNSRASLTISAFPPQASGPNSSYTDRSKQTEVDATTPLNSSTEKLWPTHSRKATALACSIVTPFGLPVDPEV